MGIAAGRLRELVSVEEETRLPNGQGGYTTAWSEVAAPRAEIIGLTGDESINAAVERSVQRWRVTMRARLLTTKHRLIWNDIQLDIKSVVPDPRAPEAAIVVICESTG